MMTADKRKPVAKDQELKALAAAPVGASPVPSEVLIVPWGQVESTSGDFTVDEESARLATEAFEAHGCDLPIDYEHQTLGGPYTSPTGQAPAAGWIQKIVARPGEGIVAEVKWTEPAVEQLAARQYRYLSPVAIVRKSDRKLVGLHSVALTNKPAIVGMAPVVNREAPSANGTEAADRLRDLLELDAQTSDEEVLVAASHRMTQLEEQMRLRQTEDRVAAALAQGKITPAQRDWATRLCLRDETLFEEYVNTAVVVVQPGRLSVPNTALAPANRSSAEAQARAEFRAHPELAALTTEDAYVADAAREAH